MSNKIEHDFTALDGLASGENTNTIPIQALPNSKKTVAWKKATVDAIERNGIKQLYKNIKFNAYRKMQSGIFTYSGTGVSDNEDFDMPWFDEKIRSLRDTQNIPTYIKHFDFIGIIVNALSGIYGQLDDKYRVESIDEYSTNEYIRQKTEMLHKYAQQTFIAEVNKLLLQRGIDVNKSDFQSQEEADAYKQEIQNQTKALTPSEIEANLSKNFKVLATEWAQNVLTADKKRFYLADLEREEFVDFLLTGRYFRHFRVGYDSYSVERWMPEETFFSQDVDAKYPQNGEYVGRITSMSISSMLNRFGHLMTQKEQEAVGNYWNQTKNYTEINGAQVPDAKSEIFPTPTVTPFNNYYDHQANVQLEEALGTPLGLRTEMSADGSPIATPTYLPRYSTETDFYANTFSELLRDDIEVRRDTVRVTEGYWRGYKRMAVLIFENKSGSTSVELVTDDLLKDFLEDNEIKNPRDVSLNELQKALKEENLFEYNNTITYLYAPEAWKFIKIKGNGSTLKKDLYLDVQPLEYQIKGEDSNIYDIKLPVVGIIDIGIASKIAPYQQLHNICMNQITELLEKELGVFFTFDITGLPSEYQDETTIESLFRIREDIKDTGLLGLDLSRQNTQGNSPNVFQRQEIVYATQVQYRWQLAQQYKQEALSQIGITPQTLGQATTYETAEGVKQGAEAKENNIPYTTLMYQLAGIHSNISNIIYYEDFLKGDLKPTIKIRKDAKEVINFDTKETYPSVSSLSEKIGISRHSLDDMFLGKSRNKTRFLYVKDFENGLKPEDLHKIDKYRYVIDISTKLEYEDVPKAAKTINMKSSTLTSMLRGDNYNTTNFQYLRDFEKGIKINEGKIKKEKNSDKRIPVIDCVTKVVYPSAKVAAKELDLIYSTLVSRISTGSNKTNLQYLSTYLEEHPDFVL